MCIVPFFDFIFINKIKWLICFIGSYYRTISNFSQIYLNQLEALLLLFLARILFAVINWTHPKSRHS
ncbi:hypothetical protein B7L13_12770 [Klebsiella oxytoca]|nr:hypothetical protein B7L13_12770 [Klebsiella oxytoca]